MFTDLIVQPIFNLLVLIYALLPGHNFGLAIIIFTTLIRLLMWPLIKKQLHHAKAMRELQPELKKIKQATKGDRQKESVMVMQLYRERQINPFSSIGIILVQLPILLGLYSGLSRLINNPGTLIDFTYPFVRDLSWMKELAGDISKFDNSLFGIVDLGRAAIGKAGGIYWPAFIIVAASAISQYYQSKQLMPTTKDGRKLRHILRDAQAGKTSDQTEISAAVGKSTQYFIPFIIFIATIGLASALGLYFLVSGLVAFVQQSKVLGRDKTELEAVADATAKKDIIEGEVVVKKPKLVKSNPSTPLRPKKQKTKNKKRRKR